MPEQAPHQKLERLRETVRKLESVLVCFSGGIDSALVLAVSRAELADNAAALTAVSPSLPASERTEAERIAQSLGVRHHLVESNELAREGYVANAPDRCFHCKTELYDIAKKLGAELGFKTIANGTNTDDLGDHRPGLEAARRAGVKSPLLDAGFSKSDVRAAARLLELDVWDKPAAACLSSRIPYGTSVTRERLAQIGAFESDLKGLGLRQLRVRWHDAIARIELDLDEVPVVLRPGVREKIVEAGKRHGFRYVTLDLGGYRTGSHNEVLAGRSLRIV